MAEPSEKEKSRMRTLSARCANDAPGDDRKPWAGARERHLGREASRIGLVSLTKFHFHLIFTTS
jgi:hypothetical protein